MMPKNTCPLKKMSAKKDADLKRFWPIKMLVKKNAS